MSSSDHYEYTYNPTTGIYSFTTRHNVTVRIVIARDRSWFPYNSEFGEVYSFDLDTDQPSPLDIRIRNTIRNILLKKFENKQTVVVYYCDMHDGRERRRHFKFDRWYKSVVNTSICKHDREVVFEGRLIYSSILIHRENTLYNRILSAYYAGDEDVTDKFILE